MQEMKHLPGVTVLEGRRRLTFWERVDRVFGTALGTYFALGIVAILYVLAGTMDYATLVGR